MNGMHWLRSRQEGEELAYWTSFVFFNPKDRSLNNRIYLIYLRVFFSVWWFIVMVWFAEAGAMLLNAVYPSNPVSLAVALVLVVLLVWFLVLLIQSLRRSPVRFSEADSYLVCQMPLRPQKLVLRWIAMPWLKGLIPFLLLVIVLGFSLARAGLAESGLTGQDLSAYFTLGFRAVLVMIPLHLALYAADWALGVWYMGRRRKKAALFVVLALGLVILLFMGFGIASALGVNLPGVFRAMGSVLADSLRTGFGEGNLGNSLIASWAIALFSLVSLFLAAKRFSPSRAAQETRAEVLSRQLQRYGLGERAQEKKVQRRLGLSRRTAWLPAWEGAPALIWKDLLQTRRAVKIGSVFTLLGFFSAAAGLAFLPGLSGRMLLILTWTLQASQFLTGRIRQDLAHWAIVRQLPIRHQRWIAADLVRAGGVILLVSLAGLGLGGAILGRFPLAEALALPGMILTVAGVSSVVVFNNAQVDLLMMGQVPAVNELGVIAGAICAAVPVALVSWFPGLVGGVFAVVASLLLAYFTLNLAFNGYRNIA
jgi:hypothetical protein